MRAVNTNVLVRLIARDDPKQVAVAEAFVTKGAWVSLLVLSEATWVLGSAYDLDATATGRAIDMLLNHRDLTIQDRETVASALEEFRRKPSLGFSDCLILAVARRAGHVPMGTFDHGLSKLANTERL